MKHLLFKTISWRVVSTVPFALVTFAVTGSIAASSSLVLIDLVGRTALYVVHEWLWDHPPASFMVVRNRLLKRV